jgi:hypothetical protein
LSAPLASPARIVKLFSLMVSMRALTSGLRRDSLRDPAMEILALSEEFDLARALIKARTAAGLSQA